MPTYRSVLQYESTDDLVDALNTLVLSADGTEIKESSVSSSETDDSPKLSDWHFPVPDSVTCRPQNVEEEAHRLQVLRNYMVLETDFEKRFDDITEEAVREFNMPVACISLVDMGRQWFKSVASNPKSSTRETARRAAICNYTIQAKDGILVVPNTLEDKRFRENPRVTGGPLWRFYAGAPLVVPDTSSDSKGSMQEGVPLGSLCVLDRQPRGFSSEECIKLKEMAARVVDQLVQRKATMEAEQVLLKRPSQTSLVNLAEEDQSPATVEQEQQRPHVELEQGPKRGRSGSLTPSKVAPSTNALLPASIIPRPALLVQQILPDPKTVGVDPDTYLSQLVEGMYGIKINLKSSLQLKDFFPIISEEQMAAYSMDIVTMARENRVDKLREVFQARGRAALDCFNRFGEGLLNMACRRGFTEMVTFFLSSEVNLSVRIRDDFGRTPLHDACWNPEPLLEICDWIMRSDPSLFFVTDKRGHTPFLYARKGDWHTWRQFLFQRRHLLEKLVTDAETLRHFS